MSNQQAVEVRPWNISPEDEAAFRAGDATAEWLYRLPSDILREHAGKWVAAKDCQIYASAESDGALLKQLEGVDLRSVVVLFIEKPGKVIYR